MAAMSEQQLPTVVQRYLDECGLAVVPRNELEELRRRPLRADCPYPLHQHKFGPTHSRFVASIGEDSAGYAFSVMYCEACGDVRLQENIPLAGPGGDQ